MKVTVRRLKFLPMFFPRCAALLAVASTAFAQAPTPAAGPTNLVANPSFETASQRDNLWDGTTRDGTLSGERFAAPVLTQAGTISEVSMPVSVALADMSGDGLKDIICADPGGLLRIFFNKGTPTEPKFTVSELTLPFLPTGGDKAYALRVPRIAAYEVNGKNSLIMGNYAGDLLLIPNNGSATNPDFRQPAKAEDLMIPTSKDPTRRWGNVFSPAVVDWNNDGKLDVLLGEGSYSANNIHLLLNQGSASSPRFDEANRHVIAFGDGREQLSVAPVDYNGDGKLDLLVSDRAGQIAIYLNKGQTWKPGDELPFKDVMKSGSGSPISMGGICTVAAGDLTGDGLFDVIVGKSNGRIAFIKNSGTKEAPKWETPVELKGEAVMATIATPSGWEVQNGGESGNLYGVIETVKAASLPNKPAPPVGESAVRIGYSTSPNKVMKAQFPAFGGTPNFKPTPETTFPQWMASGPSNTMGITQTGRLRLKPGKNYTLSFKARGNGASNATASVQWTATAQLGEDKVVGTTGRGGVQLQRNAVTESGNASVTFSPGSAWSDVKKDFKVTFKSDDLNKLPNTTEASVYFVTMLTPGTGELLLDDVQIVEKP